jgi:hypothetical protein
MNIQVQKCNGFYGGLWTRPILGGNEKNCPGGKKGVLDFLRQDDMTEIQPVTFGRETCKDPGQNIERCGE